MGMPARHRDLSPQALELVADTFRVLAEPSRLRILQALRDRERSVSDLVALLGSQQPSVSKNLKSLQRVGLVSRRAVGNAAYYAIADDVAFALCDLVCDRLAARLDAQATHLDPRRRSRKARR
jgi:DNA-binding transcriptional ArsR family regulator